MFLLIVVALWKYESFSIILIFILAYESHTKVGEKMKILIERLAELWEGKKEDDKEKKDPSVVKVTQQYHVLVCLLNTLLPRRLLKLS